VTLHRRDLEESLAASANIARMLGDATDYALAVRRANDWRDDGVKAANYDPPTTGTRTEMINGMPVTVPPLSDPVGEAATATRRPMTDHTDVVRRYNRAARDLERSLAQLTRPTTPDARELETTDPADMVRPGAGTCEVCGIEKTGLRHDRIRHSDGRPLCDTHYKGARRALEKGQTVDAYITSTRAMYGAALAATRGRRR